MKVLILRAKHSSSALNTQMNEKTPKYNQPKKIVPWREGSRILCAKNSNKKKL